MADRANPWRKERQCCEAMVCSSLVEPLALGFPQGHEPFPAARIRSRPALRPRQAAAVWPHSYLTPEVPSRITWGTAPSVTPSPQSSGASLRIPTWPEDNLIPQQPQMEKDKSQGTLQSQRSMAGEHNAHTSSEADIPSRPHSNAIPAMCQ